MALLTDKMDYHNNKFVFSETMIYGIKKEAYIQKIIELCDMYAICEPGCNDCDLLRKIKELAELAL
jgi:hypothetical protein